jgi:hypothetical protein
VSRFGQNAQAFGKDPYDDLDNNQEKGGDDGIGRRRFFFAFGRNSDRRLPASDYFSLMT